MLVLKPAIEPQCPCKWLKYRDIYIWGLVPGGIFTLFTFFQHFLFLAVYDAYFETIHSFLLQLINLQRTFLIDLQVCKYTKLSCFAHPPAKLNILDLQHFVTQYIKMFPFQFYTTVVKKIKNICQVHLLQPKI